MIQLNDIRNSILGTFAALLILAHSLLAMGLPAPYVEGKHLDSEITELKQEARAKVTFVELNSRVQIASFIVYWVDKVFVNFDLPVIPYQNCTTFFVTAFTVNPYYSFTSALAP
ncbi:hypothetical protein WJR50_31975 [Catalinimonas sp. 4WD22]|uniref:hypothetical protein n=1 Tax=Catalinimonas locisalis TaxID=3133978 RepID=UPI003101A357